VAANTGAARSATLIIGGQTFTVTQAAPPCTYKLSAASLTFTATAGSSTVTLTAGGTGCSWTASSGAAWLTVSPRSGTGTAVVTLSVAGNNGALRTATATIGGQTMTVTQSSKAPSAPKGLKVGHNK
jgi:hypothetical protein